MARKSPKSVVTELTVSSAACSALFGIQQATLRSWKSKGCPAAGHNQWFLPNVIEWWQNNLLESKQEDFDNSLAEIKRNYWSHRARREKVKADEAEEQVLPISELVEEWCCRAGVYRAGLLSYSSRLPPLLVGKKQLEMRQILHDESCLLLAALSKDHQYCPASALPEEYTDLQNLEIVKKNPPQKRKRKNGK
ncbi:hypothetical protein ACFLZQ_05290 [Thermodesulfobacteriota bacterium]